MIVLQTQFGTIIHVKFVEWCHCGLLEIIRTLSVSCSLLLCLSPVLAIWFLSVYFKFLDFIYFNRFGNVWSSKYVRCKYALSVHVFSSSFFVHSFSFWSASTSNMKWHHWSMHHIFGRMFIYSTHCKSVVRRCVWLIGWSSFYFCLLH